VPVDPFKIYTCISPTVDEAVVLEIWSPRIQELAQRLARSFKLEGRADEDLAQEARLRILRVARSGRPLAPPYVWKVIKNAMWSALKRYRLNRDHESPLFEDESQPKPEFSVYQPNSDVILTGWVQTLPRRLREVYHLLFVEELTQQEAGVKLNISQARIAQIRHALLERTRERLGNSR
jgi:RNA polymerase sigma factor (sigma-70 family)